MGMHISEQDIFCLIDCREGSETLHFMRMKTVGNELLEDNPAAEITGYFLMVTKTKYNYIVMLRTLD